MGRNTTGPPHAAPWLVTLRRGVLQTPTDDDDWRTASKLLLSRLHYV